MGLSSLLFGSAATYHVNMRRGFTLVELLVVIAIIALLAAILFPVIAAVKGNAKKVKCLSNLRQIGTAIALYQADWDDVFPFGMDAVDKYAPNWWSGNPAWQAMIAGTPMMSELLQDYARSPQIFECPSDTGTKVLDNHFPDPFPTSPSMFKQYGMSYFLRTEIVFSGATGTTFVEPAKINVMFDAAGHWHGGGRELREDDDFETFMAVRRGYRYNTLFGDLHAKTLSADALNAAWASPVQ
jgi:prepilin-type N-terminal cleavage/methylation domain-containing protein